jgi:hypothetical protein
LNNCEGSILYWICISIIPTHPLADNYSYAKLNEIKKKLRLVGKKSQLGTEKKFESGQRSRGSKGQGNTTTVNKYPKKPNAFKELAID